MKIALSMIEGGDFKRAGQATSELKELLKKINIHPADLRRTIIAAFESEMNVVIHARRGSMRSIIDATEVEVEVRDEGPGIPDIALAMQEGFSTAPPAARQMGYGAGMGLPNIKKNTDLFELTSAVGQGTRLVYTVMLRPCETAGSNRHSLQVIPGRCNGCFFCVRACPTKALRVRDDRPQILGQLCIDCAVCLSACPAGAFAMINLVSEVRPAAEETLVVPTPFLTQFSAHISPRRVLRALETLGYGSVITTLPWEIALRAEVMRRREQDPRPGPVISPVCPAVVNLIRLRFPALLDSLAPLLSPLEAAQRELRTQKAVMVVSCPGQLSALHSAPKSRPFLPIAPLTLRQAVQPLAMDGQGPAAEDDGMPGREITNDPARGILKVTGFRHVITALERIENGRLRDVRVLEPFACDLGCYGSPLFTENPYVGLYRFRRARLNGRAAGAHRREPPLSARSGMQIDEDLTRGIAKLQRMDEVMETLPGKDCGLCGAPSCQTLAEDIVLERADLASCPYSVRKKGESP